MATISLKALVDTKKNKVAFVEADGHFLDVLFSFLTMPIGTIIKLMDKYPPTSSVGCMNNLYASVEKLDGDYFWTEFCRTILLNPQNAARDEYKNLKLKIDKSNRSGYFLCQSRRCTISGHKLVSCYGKVVCCCGNIMTDEIPLYEGKQDHFKPDALEGGVYVKRLVRQLVTDDLQLVLASTTSSIGQLSKLGFTNCDGLEESTFAIGENEVLGLLKYSLMSNTPLTTVLLKPEANVADPRKDDSIKSKHPGYQIKEERVSTECKNISIKLVISKSDRKVCYAEAGEDFVDLLFSFLTIPLGYILKEMSNEPSKGCTNRLYESVRDIDAHKYLKSVDIKNLLLSPKIASCHGYPNHPLGLEEAKQQLYYYRYQGFLGVEEMLTTDAQIVPSGCTSKGVALSLKDPKSPPQKDTSTCGGYVRGPAMFTVRDDLVIVPISPVSALNILKGMKVPFCDVEERVVSMGKQEVRYQATSIILVYTNQMSCKICLVLQALRLLLAAFSSDSALTDAFLRRQAN